jgi:hypothetical protein
VQPLVLRFNIAGELGALDLPTVHVVLDLEQGVPRSDAFLDGGGHAALLLDSSCRTPQLSWRNRRQEGLLGPSLEQAFLRAGASFKFDAFRADTSGVTPLRPVGNRA